MSETVFTSGEMRRNESQEENTGKKSVDKTLYILLAVFLGCIGVHKFYAGKIGAGVLYLLFCWTLIPEILALFDIIKACGKLKDTQNRIWI